MAAPSASSARSAGTADPLRSTLDSLQLDPRSEADRPYLVAMLRRLGYTEREIDEVVRTGRMPEGEPAVEPEAPGRRDYRLVVPARDSRFAVEATPALGTDAPFEDLGAVEFEDLDDYVDFTPPAEPAPEALEPLQQAHEEIVGDPAEQQWSEEPPQAEAQPDDLQWSGQQPETWETEPEAPAEAGFDAGSIDTFGSAEAVAPPPKTRVRVRRVRAASREEAERKVSGGGRRVLKAVPVDIVERWGGEPKPPERKGKEG